MEKALQVINVRDERGEFGVDRAGDEVGRLKPIELGMLFPAQGSCNSSVHLFEAGFDSPSKIFGKVRT
jgi:hypothetical protein